MISPLKQIFGGDTKAGVEPLGLMSFASQEADLNWWRPLIIPFRPIVILFNLLIGSRNGESLTSGGRSPQPVMTNEQTYEITWDETDRPVKVVVHRQVNEL